MSVGSETRVFVSTAPDDFRRGVHGLVALVADGLQDNPYSGDIFVFRSKRANRLKILAFDGTGMILATKQLQHSNFRWPPVVDGVMKLTSVEYAALFDGLDWGRIISTQRIPTPTQAG